MVGAITPESAEAMLRDPTVTMGQVRGPGPVNLPRAPTSAPAGTAGHLHNPVSLSGSVKSDGSHLAPGDGGARVAIARGAAEVAGEEAASIGSFQHKSEDADARAKKIKRDVD
jgi:conjugal transfer mating pair stabilization protein TraG